MPVIAHFEDLAQVGERRRSVRRTLLLGVGAGGEFVTIRDISLTGMLLETSAAMLVGATFEVERRILRLRVRPSDLAGGAERSAAASLACR
jgi:hypothetical protein